MEQDEKVKTLLDLNKSIISKKINHRTNYQRNEVWNEKKKARFIFVLLKGLITQKIYLHEKKNSIYDTIDGQQRLLSISGFFSDEFALSTKKNEIESITNFSNDSTMSVINRQDISGKLFSQLSSDVKEYFQGLLISVVYCKKATNDEIHQLYVDLNDGVALKQIEIMHAIPSKITNYIIKRTDSKLFGTVSDDKFNKKNCLIPGLEANNRFQQEEIVTSCLFLVQKLKNKVDNFEEEIIQVTWHRLREGINEKDELNDEKSVEYKSLTSTTDKIFGIFEKALKDTNFKKLKKLVFLDMFIFILFLINKGYNINIQQMKYFFSFFNNMLENDKEYTQALKEMYEEEFDIIENDDVNYPATRNVRQTRLKFNFIKKLFINSIDKVETFGGTYLFDLSINVDRHNLSKEREILWNESNECRLCGLEIKHIHHADVDHKVPLSEGGDNNIENLQLSCTSCNRSAGNKK